ncbi:hypothetical protein Barb6_01646 [Bacteroidales bacterium Barb6]|nr:hypothetical protein Barb6_01646 [Bacteroidales bacterium Barb6]
MRGSERSGKGVLKEQYKSQMMIYNIRSFFQNLLVIALLTPHSAALHVGLKSLTLLGHLRNISYKLKRI